jgi:hypothetical protein
MAPDNKTWSMQFCPIGLSYHSFIPFFVHVLNANHASTSFRPSTTLYAMNFCCGHIHMSRSTPLTNFELRQNVLTTIC